MTIVQNTPPRNAAPTINKFGYNTSVDATSNPVDITPFGNHTFQSTAIAAADIDIVSSDDADNGATATGALAMFLDGLGSDGYHQTETITLDGNTDTHPTLDWLHINRANCTLVGSGGVNAGTITIDENGSNTMAVIPITDGQTQQCTYWVPLDYEQVQLVGLHADMTVKQAQTATVKLQYRKCAISSSGTVTCESWRTIMPIGVSSQSNPPHDFSKQSLKFDGFSQWRLRAVSASAASLPINGYFTLWLYRKKS